MKFKITLLIKILLLFSLTIFYTCNKKDFIPEKESILINTGTEANKEEIKRLNNVLSPETLITNFSILVSDESNKPVTNAQIEIGTKTVRTDDNGFVFIENITVNAEFQTIRTNSEGYTKSLKTITPSNNGVTNITITLLKPSFDKSFDAKNGGTISNEKLSIDFPSDAIADQKGNLYEGEVKATVTYYDPNSATFIATIPGTLAGLDDNDAMQALISKGMIKVDLTNSLGEELELFDGKQATITLPAGNDDPEVIDFWHLNEEKGIWVQAGTATKKDNKYTATVKHFSTYNLDVKVAPIDITFIIKDTNENVIANQTATIIATNESGTYSKRVSTDNMGKFTIIKAPKGADFNINLSIQCEPNVNLPVGTINQTTTKVLTIEPLFSANSVTPVTIKGTLKKCNNEVLANKVFFINIVNGSTTDRISAYTDTEGKYSITSLLCNYDNSTTYQAEVRVYDDENLIIKDTEIIFDTEIQKDIIVCDGVIIEIDNGVIGTGDFSNFFTLSISQTTDILNLTVLDDGIEVTQIALYDTGSNLVGFYFGNTRTMNVSYLFPNSYTMTLQTNKGEYSTEFIKL